MKAFSSRVRVLILLLTLGMILALINMQILIKERIVGEGQVILLQLAPRDPRSLLQGDYMTLRYALTAEVASAAREAGLSDGLVLVSLDENRVARFEALYVDQTLQQGQYLLRYRRRGDSVRLASDAFFFEEGQGDLFATARFGELRVGGNGEAVLTGLVDAEYQRLGAALH